jgi:hypothetical protein
MLQYMEKLEVFDPSEGVPPMVILDGHNSRFDSEYLDYCNDDEHLWTPMLGVSYASNMWQVGYSPQQSGAFKIDLSRWKQWLRRSKEKHAYNRCLIERTDIMLLVRKAWAWSFA